MNDDKTVIMRPANKEDLAPSQIQVTYTNRSGVSARQVFSQAFIIGRHTDCELSLNDDGISRKHVEIFPTAHGWSVRDLGSSNGTLLDGRPVQEAPVQQSSLVQPGHDGPKIKLELLESSSVISNRPIPEDQQISSEEIYQRYVGERTGPMGEHTKMVRNVIHQVKKKQTNRFRMIVSGLCILLLVLAGLIVYQQVKLTRAKELAVDMFYDMKTIQVQISQTELQIRKTGSMMLLADVEKKRGQLEEMEQRYHEYINELESFKFIEKKISTEDELIMRMAREFGECDLELPEGFVEEVKSYIGKWKNSARFSQAMKRFENRGYKSVVLDALKTQGLPPQFVYLSLQESNFKYDAIGPETRFGIAKGAWQFIPSTATEYGLKIGPLSSVRKYDPEDERFDFGKSTEAASKYLKFIYSMEAQASGLLVMASYNWGQNRVKRLVNKMPDNPKERNFWRLIQDYRIPEETYNYVFYIFSAAVIGEDPELFGFDFENPLIDEN